MEKQKLSINLYLLAIIFFAITSAFTTVKQKKFLALYAVWGINQAEVQYYLPVSIFDLICSVNEVLYVDASPLSNFGYYSLEEFREYYDDGLATCYANINYVCMVYVRYSLDFPFSGEVFEELDGDFEHIQ